MDLFVGILIVFVTFIFFILILAVVGLSKVVQLDVELAVLIAIKQNILRAQVLVINVVLMQQLESLDHLTEEMLDQLGLDLAFLLVQELLE